MSEIFHNPQTSWNWMDCDLEAPSDYIYIHLPITTENSWLSGLHWVVTWKIVPNWLERASKNARHPLSYDSVKSVLLGLYKSGS